MTHEQNRDVGLVVRACVAHTFEMVQNAVDVLDQPGLGRHEQAETVFLLLLEALGWVDAPLVQYAARYGAPMISFLRIR
jgi:hypothetical protein